MSGTAVVTQQDSAETLYIALLYLNSVPHLICRLYQSVTQILVYGISQYGPTE